MTHYVDLEKKHDIKDKLIPDDYEIAVRWLDEYFMPVWEEVQAWRPAMDERYMLKQRRWMEQLHQVVEQGLKILLKIRGDFIDKRPNKHGCGDKHHDLLPLFQKVPMLDQGIVRRQFDIYASFYDHIGDMSLEDYLSKWGQGDMYINNRLAAVEAVGQSWGEVAGSHEEMHPWVMAELAQALVSILCAKAYTDHGAYTIDLRLEHAIEGAIKGAYETPIPKHPADGGDSAVEAAMDAMWSFVEDRGGWINTAAYLIRGGDVPDGDEYLRAWLTAAKERLQADTADAPQSLDMRLFLERAVRENVRWDATGEAFFTDGPKHEAYRAFDGDDPYVLRSPPYVLRWQQGDRRGCIPLDRDNVPDWRTLPERGARITLALDREGMRELADSVNGGEATRFVLLRDGEERMTFLALLVPFRWGTAPNEKVRVRLCVCHEGDDYGVLSMPSREHGTLPWSWIGYRRT